MPDSINGNLDARVVVNTIDMAWTASPSGTVWRKRVHRVGPAEAGQVTSVVRYERDSQFPAHDHPDGEEILVLEGVFSDEQGDWPAGSYLLNPEGFRHAPFSRPGCVLFVKLRQYPGTDRAQVSLDLARMPWTETGRPGVRGKHLYEQAGFADSMRLLQWDAAAGPGELQYEDGVEYFVIEGAFADEDNEYPAGTWLRLPPGSRHAPRSAGGCILYEKRGGFAYLDGAGS